MTKRATRGWDGTSDEVMNRGPGGSPEYWDVLDEWEYAGVEREEISVTGEAEENQVQPRTDTEPPDSTWEMLGPDSQSDREDLDCEDEWTENNSEPWPTSHDWYGKRFFENYKKSDYGQSRKGPRGCGGSHGVGVGADAPMGLYVTEPSNYDS